MRDRLVQLLDDATVEKTKYYPNGIPAIMYCEKAVNRDTAIQLADKILADGWIRPPCKVGDKVYRVSTRSGTKLKYIQETTISRIAIDNEGIWLFCTCNPIAKCVFGKTVFLTREEAEQALKGGAE